MAIGKKSGGRDFQKGVSGNPEGRPALPEEVRQARRINQSEFELICNRLFFLPTRELKKIIKSPDTPAIEKMLAKLVAMACATGDYKRINALLGRTIGKVTTEVEAGLTDAEREALKHGPEEKGAANFAELAQRAAAAKKAAKPE